MFSVYIFVVELQLSLNRSTLRPNVRCPTIFRLSAAASATLQWARRPSVTPIWSVSDTVSPMALSYFLAFRSHGQNISRAWAKKLCFIRKSSSRFASTPPAGVWGVWGGDFTTWLELIKKNTRGAGSCSFLVRVDSVTRWWLKSQRCWNIILLRLTITDGREKSSCYLLLHLVLSKNFSHTAAATLDYFPLQELRPGVRQHKCFDVMY